MIKDFTNIQQSLLLLKAGADPMTANFVLQRLAKDGEWTLIDNSEQDFLSLEQDGDDVMKVTMEDFPTASFEEQKRFVNAHSFIPSWSLGALLNIIPDDRKQTMMITRGGYDSSVAVTSEEDGYLSDVYFANYDYEDNKNNVFFGKTYGGDTYIDAVIKMVVDYLTNIRKQIT